MTISNYLSLTKLRITQDTHPVSEIRPTVHPYAACYDVQHASSSVYKKKSPTKKQFTFALVPRARNRHFTNTGRPCRTGTMLPQFIQPYLVLCAQKKSADTRHKKYKGP